MPRALRVRFAHEIAQLRKQAGRLLAKVRSEIRSVETELAHLKASASSLLTLAGMRLRGSERKAGQRTGGPSRVNWTNVLERMPQRFKAGDVRKVSAVQNKRPSEIFAGITRWIEAGSVKRKERGLYEKVQPEKQQDGLTFVANTRVRCPEQVFGIWFTRSFELTKNRITSNHGNVGLRELVS